jgi:hypothetical protein
MSCWPKLQRRDVVKVGLAHAVVCWLLPVSAAGQPVQAASSPGSLEDIFVVRSVPEASATPTAFCADTRTGFATTAENRYTFRSVATRASDGFVTDADAAVVGTVHACFGPLPDDAASLHFYAEGTLGDVAFTGRGNCLSTRVDYPEQGLRGFRCYLALENLPDPYLGGQMTTNTIGSQNPLGPVTDPPGYVQSSIATIRLWKRRP